MSWGKNFSSVYVCVCRINWIDCWHGKENGMYTENDELTENENFPQQIQKRKKNNDPMQLD